MYGYISHEIPYPVYHISTDFICCIIFSSGKYDGLGSVKRRLLIISVSKILTLTLIVFSPLAEEKIPGMRERKTLKMYFKLRHV